MLSDDGGMMSQKTHYFKIGLFVIAAVGLAVVGLVVLGAGKWLEKATQVETYFVESVQGLEVGAPVRIRGVRMGSVESIRLAREEYGLSYKKNPSVTFPYKGVVVVRMSVRPSVALNLQEEDMKTAMQEAVDTGFRFRLASQGITGVLYIESDFVDPERYPPMEIVWTPKTPYIPSAPSTTTEIGTELRSVARKFEQLEIDKVMKNLDGMLTTVTQFVSDLQSEHLVGDSKQVLADMRGAIQEARRVLDNPYLTKTLKDSSAAMEDFRRTAADMSHTAKDAREAMAQFPEVMARLNKSARRIDSLLASKGETVDELLENMRSVSEELRYLTKSVEKYPSQVIFGEPPPRTQAVKR